MVPSDHNERLLDPAKGYLLFEKLFAPVEKKIMADTPALAGYSKKAVGRRLVQEIVRLTVYPFVQFAATRHAQGIDGGSIAVGETVELKGFCFRHNTASVTFKTWARSLVEFCIQWLRVTACLAAPTQTLTPQRSTLIYGVGIADLDVNGSDARFISFCEHGPLPPLNGAAHFVIESARTLTSSNPKRASYAREPLLALLRSRPPRGDNLLRFIGAHLSVAASFFRCCLTHPLCCLLARDMAFHVAAADLNRRGALEAVVISNARFDTQPLWMRAMPERRFKAHMVWYSQNMSPFVFKKDGMRANLPHFRHIKVDNCWVWTEAYANHIRELIPGAQVTAVGPILWHLPENADNPRVAPSVAIFDVTPVRSAYAQKIGLPRNYYSADNMIAFLEKAVTACERAASSLGQPISVLLKHKRAHTDLHDSSYIELVDRLVAAERIQLVPPQTNMYSLISASTAAIVAPFSSPAYVASALGVPAIYFDATNSIEATHELAPLVDFTADESALAEKLCAALDIRYREACHE